MSRAAAGPTPAADRAGGPGAGDGHGSRGPARTSPRRVAADRLRDAGEPAPRSRGGARGRGGGARDARRRRPARGIRSSRPRESRSTFAVGQADEPAEPPEPAGSRLRSRSRSSRSSRSTRVRTHRAAPVRPHLAAGRRVAVLVLLVGGIALLGPVRDALAAARTRRVRARADPEELDRADEVATGAGLQTSDIASLRSLGRAFGHDFWVFRDDRRVCLISRPEFFFGWVETCAALEVFAAHGLTRRIPADDIRDGAVRDGSDRATWSWSRGDRSRPRSSGPWSPDGPAGRS